jgi:hypothetical protein
MHSMSKFLVICDGAVYQNFQCSAFYFFILFFIFLLCIIILFVYFILCFALLCFYVSLHYVLPALQFNCACLIVMNMYVLLVSCMVLILMNLKIIFLFWNGKSYTCIACQNFLVICEGRYTKTFTVLLFILFALHYYFICVLYFVLCFAVFLCFIALSITCFAI